MSMVINTNIQATRTHNVYNKNNSYMNEALTRVATGQKINSAKDGAANWAISEKMRERIRANDQANQNVQNDTALLKTAQGGIDNTIDILKTLKERALNSANDSNINTDRSAIATEVYQLLEQINDNAAKVKFNGRTLLNGDYDNGAADMFPAASTSSTSTSATPADNPTDRGTNAVYKLELSSIAPAMWDTSTTTHSTAAVANTTKLVDLVSDASVTSDAQAKKNRVFQDGDYIKFTWKENGEAKQTTVQVNAGLTLEGLATKLGASTKDSMNAGYVASGTGLNVGDSGDVKDSGEGSAATAVSADANGIYAVGNANVKITDFAVEVTDIDGNIKTDAQDALKFTGVQQATDPTTGSHSVFKLDGLFITGNASIDSTTAFSAIFATDGSGTAAIGATTFKIGNDEINILASDTVTQAAAKFQAKGYNLQLVSAANTQIVDKNANDVMQNTLDGSTELTASPTGNAELYIIGAEGKTFDKVTITVADATNKMALNSHLSNVQVAGAGASGSSSNSMTFHVGGEADFYLDMNIKTMTTQSLLGSDSKTFATMFTDKATARDAVGIIDTAIQTALNEQTKLGAMESRLGYTSDNITTMNENLEAADSVYRDSDIAKEMTNYMKYTVLAQSSQYMLAQTSQNAFSVLNLLQA